MHAETFLQDLAVVMIIAGFVTIIFHRFKQSVVLGYILAGIIIGPHTPPYSLIHEKETIDTLAELGVVLLMFSLGLEFSLRKLKQVGAPAFIAALMEILLLFWVGYEIAHFFKWPTMDRIFLGAMLSMSSTTVIIKVLGDLGKMKERFAQLIFGILIIEDILGIAMIALLSGIAMSGNLSFGDVGVTLGKLGIFLVVVLIAGLIFVPRLIGYVARFKSNEMLIITVLALCFGVSLLAVKLGYSVALGAFIIGAVVAEAREIHRIETLIEPVRDMFSAIFFVAIGLLIDPKMIVVYWQPIVAITIALVVGKVLTCSFGAFVGGNDRRTSLRVGMGLAQIGEFSFIIASLGVTLKVTSSFLYPIAVAVSVITTLLTPYLIGSADKLVKWFDRVAPESLTNGLEIYTNWIGQLGGEHKNMAGSLVRRWIFQMSLNAALIAAVFISAGYIGRHPAKWISNVGLNEQWLKPSLWLLAMILSLPMFIATARKLQALGLLLAETRVSKAAAGERTAAIRAIISAVVPIAGTVALGLFVLVLSSTLLPSLKVFFVLLAIVAVVAWLLWRSFIKVYSKAQIALHETFANEPPPKHAPQNFELSPLLREADLETVTLLENSFAIGKLIRELQLRSETGASIVGIERGGASILNPGPDEELLVNDHVLLLGTKTQLDAGKQLLAKQSEQV
jgi:CPA2 family monovalent cation:H+ antiporter-2